MRMRSKQVGPLGFGKEGRSPGSLLAHQLLDGVHLRRQTVAQTAQRLLRDDTSIFAFIRVGRHLDALVAGGIDSSTPAIRAEIADLIVWAKTQKTDFELAGKAAVTLGEFGRMRIAKKIIMEGIALPETIAELRPLVAAAHARKH